MVLGPHCLPSPPTAAHLLEEHPSKSHEWDWGDVSYSTPLPPLYKPIIGSWEHDHLIFCLSASCTTTLGRQFLDNHHHFAVVEVTLELAYVDHARTVQWWLDAIWKSSTVARANHLLKQEAGFWGSGGLVWLVMIDLSHLLSSANNIVNSSAQNQGCNCSIWLRASQPSSTPLLLMSVQSSYLLHYVSLVLNPYDHFD